MLVGLECMHLHRVSSITMSLLYIKIHARLTSCSTGSTNYFEADTYRL